ncbi:MAG: response regulator [Bacteroidales bacterium]|nr:response regulator [Bacteroidales bacterium]MCF8388709.1 response regulator [Bacteroidales bacterium]MCF8399502.1 response regulator [Bacteroidales bacterium]
MQIKKKGTICFIDADRKNDVLIRDLQLHGSFEIIQYNNIHNIHFSDQLKKTDLIIINCAIPDNQIWDFCRKARKSTSGKNTSILLLADKKNTEEISNAFDAGITDFIQKPFDKQEIIKKIELLIDYSGTRRELKASKKANTIFLSNLSHEIRTPMNGIIGMVDILKQTELGPEQMEYLDIIEGSGENLLNIINDILDFTNIIAGHIRFERVDFNLRKKIDELNRLMRFKARERGISFKVSVSKEVPEMLRGDPIRLKQILTNLCNNAIKFTPRGHVSVRVKAVETSAKNKIKLKFEVKDTGIGISPEDANKLLTSFAQIDSGSIRKYGGTGLGLAIANHLTQLLGGEFSFTSEPGKGSTFWFSIAFDSIATSPGQLFDEEDVEPMVSGLNILVAEDNAINQIVAKINFEKLGHKVFIADNGREAIQNFRNNKVDFVFMDASMPELDGIEASKKIREYERAKQQARETPIILMVNSLQSKPENFSDLGISDCINKPFKIVQLIKILNKFAAESAAT